MIILFSAEHTLFKQQNGSPSGEPQSLFLQAAVFVKRRIAGIEIL
jgi:hypothetical protein